MAVKIINRGVVPGHEPFRGTCKNCRSLIECERADGTTEYDLREGGEFLRLSCPVCNVSMVLYPQKTMTDAEINRQVARMQSAY